MSRARVSKVAATATLVCVAAIVGRAAAGGTAQTDGDALRAVAISNPSFNQSWLNDDHCSWRGVFCKHSRVTRLSLRFFDVHGRIPAELSGLTSLELLDLGSNKLGGPIPAELGLLKSLVTLDLQHNELSGQIPADLGGLTSLATLDLDYNSLTGPIPSELGRLRALKQLTLHSNQLTSFIPAVLANLTSLVSLDLAQNVLTGPIPAELGHLTSLTNLYLYDNHLSGPVPKELTQLTSAYVSLGCIKDLSSSDRTLVCTTLNKRGYLFFDIPDKCRHCQPASSKNVVAFGWGSWLIVALIAAVVVSLVSARWRSAASALSKNVTAIGICKYAWGLLSFGFILFDVITNYWTVQALVGSWTLYVVAFLIVWQQLVSGLMLYTQCVRFQSWPLSPGLCAGRIGWVWDWRRCILPPPSQDNTGVGKCRVRCLDFLLWPLGLLYVVLLDVQSLLSLKLGLHLKVDEGLVNLKPYWASRELTVALLQALPQAVFQTAIVVARAKSRVSKIAITTPQFVLSVSSSLGSVVIVLAMALWEAQMEERNLWDKLRINFLGICPLMEDRQLPVKE